jgi:hypothetical protein
MATRLPLTLVTDRDRDLMLALDRTPLTVRQLLSLSETFTYPFTAERRVQERLAKLCAVGWVRRWHYVTAGRGALGYYTLSLQGYRILYGENAVPLTRHCFSEVGVARQHHTRCLADFIVNVAVSAKRTSLLIRNFYRENVLRIDVGEERLFPDCSFQLTGTTGRSFSFFVELDTGSERVQSDKDIDSWERKIQLYESYRTASGNNFRLLAVATRSSERLKHILAAAARLAPNPRRSLVYGIVLPEYLRCEHPLTSTCWLDHRGQPVGLVDVTPPMASEATAVTSQPSPISLAVC